MPNPPRATREELTEFALELIRSIATGDITAEEIAAFALETDLDARRDGYVRDGYRSSGARDLAFDDRAKARARLQQVLADLGLFVGRVGGA